MNRTSVIKVMIEVDDSIGPKGVIHVLKQGLGDDFICGDASLLDERMIAKEGYSSPRHPAPAEGASRG